MRHPGRRPPAAGRANERAHASRGGAHPIGGGRIVGEIVRTRGERGRQLVGRDLGALEGDVRQELRGDAAHRGLRLGALEVLPRLGEQPRRIDGRADRGVPGQARAPEQQGHHEADRQARRLRGGGQAAGQPGEPRHWHGIRGRDAIRSFHGRGS
jgi:hypothetical protein